MSKSSRSSGEFQLQTEHTFTLPFGYVDAEGTVHREGVMRLATAIDEIAPLRDPRVRANQAYLTIILLARVVTRLGSLPDVNTGVIESLFSADMVFLQDLYQRINQPDANVLSVSCPSCNHTFDVNVLAVGES